MHPGHVFEVKPTIKPDSPQSEVAQGFDRIPVSMVVDGDEVDWDEQKDEKSGTPKERHIKDEDSESHQNGPTSTSE